MKKLLLSFVFLLTYTISFAQSTFNQPSIFNNVCDDNGDGIGMFYMQEISFEIVANSTDYTITHHLTQTDASIGANPIPSAFTNITNPQLIFARIVTISTGQVDIIAYNLSVIPQPVSRAVTLVNCTDITTSFPCWNLNSMIPEILSGLGDSYIIGFYQTEADAQNQTNIIANPFCYISPFAIPTQPPVFYRLDNGFGCSAVGTVYLVTTDCEPCDPPNVTVTNVTESNFVITSNTISEIWEIATQVAGGPPPNSGIISDEPTTVITGLNCGTTYEIYVRKYCAIGSTQVSAWSSPITITTFPCGPQFGQPQSFIACVDNDETACFNLTDNDDDIIGTMNPSDYTITYHISASEAEININPLSSPFCIGANNTFYQEIYARITNNDASYFTSVFYINVRTYDNNTSFLQPMTQCDEDGNGEVIFDLTTALAQINSTNPIAFYATPEDAQNETNPLLNPSAFTLSTGMFSAQVFIRETITGNCDLIYNMQLSILGNCNLASDCSSANSLCASLGTPFANTINAPSIGTFGCLFTSPNPTWFYLPISQAGTINLLIQQGTDSNVAIPNLDADYVVFGPFSDPVTPCEGQLIESNIVSCSYSALPTENVTINNTLPGQYYLFMVTNFSNNPGYIKITDVGGGTGAIDCSGMRLNAFLDSNNNGTKDADEQGFPLGSFSYEKNDSGVVHNVTAPLGIYNLYEINPSNTYDLSYTIDTEYTSMYNVNPSSYTNVSSPAGSGMVVYNFPVTNTSSYNDIAVTIVPLSSPRAGFTYQNKLVYTNYGSQTVANSTLSFTKDAIVSIVSTSEVDAVLTTNGFSYSFTNLLPFETREIIVTMQVPPIPTVTLGQIVVCTASIEPIVDDIVPSNNVATDTQTIIGSYDPNDKMESHGGKILYSSFTANDYLTYTIRFENTGTASAINVRIDDILDSQLDPTSIKMVSSSHNYVLDRVDNRLVWKFENILLEPSIEGSDIGKGYVTFKVKPRAGFEIGDIIPNTASIYFDFNPAIVTNTFTTEFVRLLSVGEFENSDFVLFPNPTRDFVTINVKDNSSFISSIKITDVLGKVILSKNSNQQSETIDLSSVNSGMYFVEIVSDTNQKTIKKLLVK